jgi:hypothetical protein
MWRSGRVGEKVKKRVRKTEEQAGEELSVGRAGVCSHELEWDEGVGLSGWSSRHSSPL